MTNFKSTSLAEQRTKLAAIRTLLAFIRTGLVCISVAFAFLKLEKDKPVDWITVVLFAVGALFVIGGVIEYAIAVKHAETLAREAKNGKDD